MSVLAQGRRIVLVLFRAVFFCFGLLSIGVALAIMLAASLIAENGRDFDTDR